MRPIVSLAQRFDACWSSVSVSDVSKQMGHKDASITLKVYSHLIKERRPEAAAKTDARLFQVPAAVQQPTTTIQ